MSEIDSEQYGRDDEEYREHSEKMDRLAMSFQACFGGADGEDVMAELCRFCYGSGVSTFVVDDPHGRESAFKEGRREVYERIKALVNRDIGKKETRQTEVENG